VTEDDITENAITLNFSRTGKCFNPIKQAEIQGRPLRKWIYLLNVSFIYA
jgi:hypothetical protein